jgi:hypothetical protein
MPHTVPFLSRAYGQTLRLEPSRGVGMTLMDQGPIGSWWVRLSARATADSSARRRGVQSVDGHDMTETVTLLLAQGPLGVPFCHGEAER